MGAVFENLLNDLAQLCGESGSLELLWLSEPVSGQKVPARMRVFLLPRKLSSSAYLAEQELDSFLSGTEAILTQKGCSLAEAHALNSLPPGAGEQLHALVRQEKVPLSLFAQFPYYHNERPPYSSPICNAASQAMIGVGGRKGHIL